VLAGPAGQLVLSAQVLSEFHVVATRKLAAPLSERDAAEAIRLWGAQIGAAAAVAGCDRVLTEDLPDGAELSSVRVENPFR
jgi:predicted nucleic acid-binding protein